MRKVRIEAFGDPALDLFARKTENELLRLNEPAPGIFIAESPNVIERALKAGMEPVSVLAETKEAEGGAARRVIELADRNYSGRDGGENAGNADPCRSTEAGLPVYTADASVLRELTGFPMTRGLLCAFRRPVPKRVEEICGAARRIAVLEAVMNPTNVGAIFRSAAALNMDAVLLTGGCSDPLYRRAARVSMGTVFQVPWTWITEKTIPGGAERGRKTFWPESGMEYLRKLGFRTAAMALRHDTVSIDDPRLRGEEKLAVILGTEGEGLAEETIETCDYTVKIPMTHGVDSLNVAAASAVAFWELGKK